MQGTSQCPPSGEVELYINGRCDVFAIALSEIIEGEIRVCVTTIGELGDPDFDGDPEGQLLLHAWVLVGDMAIDARGRSDEQSLASEYDGDIQTVTPKKLQRWFGTYPGPLAEAREFVAKYKSFYLSLTSGRDGAAT